MQPALHSALDVVIEATRHEPLRALAWLSLLQGVPSGIEDDAAALQKIDAIVEACVDRGPQYLGQIFRAREIDGLLEGLPSEIPQPDHPDFDPDCVDTALRLSEVHHIGKLYCLGMGSGGFALPSEPAGWSVPGLMMSMMGITGRHDHREATFPKSRLPALYRGLWLPGDATVDTRLRQSYHEPLGLMVPAYVDTRQRVHDVTDILVERLDAVSIARLANWSMNDVALDAPVREAMANLWAAQACRLHDMVRFEFPALYKSEAWADSSTTGTDPLMAGGRVSCVITQMVCHGARLTPSCWGEDRYFGNDDVPEMHALALAVARDMLLDDAAKRRVLESLRDMGHDVVVAHRAREDKDRLYANLPLVSAVLAESPKCVAALLEWGADPLARIHNRISGSMTSVDYARLVDADAQNRLVGLIVASQARQAAREALEGLAPASQPSRP